MKNYLIATREGKTMVSLTTTQARAQAVANSQGWILYTLGGK